jgi:isochorismate synthase
MQDRFYWEHVESGNYFCAWGVSDELEASGPDRFADVRSWSRGIVSRLVWIGAPRPLSAPLFPGGFGFEEEGPRSGDWKAFPAARFVLPKILIERDGEALRAIFFVRVEPGAQVPAIEDALARRAEELVGARAPAPGTTSPAPLPDPMEAIGFDEGEGAGPEYRVRSDRSHVVFEGQVAQALAAIEAKEFEKVVLARSLRVDHDGEVDVPAFLERLRGLYPTCTLLAVGRGQDTFLAATPETLVCVEGRRVSTAALAGSAPRGREPAEDARLAAALTGSGKERAEHAHVVNAIRDVLSPLCVELDAPTSPSLRQLFGIQHLETRIVGTLSDAPRGGSETSAPTPDLLGIAAALHPTPAVGGAPSRPACQWLRRFEGLDRGWYASPVGWLDGEGGGNLRVALRSGLIRNGIRSQAQGCSSRSLLFAGAGIVAGSQPQNELVETRIKLRALLAPLTEI